MDFVTLLHLAKYVGVLAFAMGVALALAPGHARVRQRAAHWLATPGFVLTWIAGWGMAREAAIPLAQPWITISMAASLVALHEAIRAVEPGRESSRARASLALLALFVALAAMVVRHG